MSSKKPKPKRQIKRLTLFEKKKRLITTPIDDHLLSIREMKGTDKFEIMNILNETKRDYYIGVYKVVFRSWFTYAIITSLLGLSLSLVQSSMPSICLPPFLVTIFLIWKVNRYKRINRTYSSVDLEMINMNEQLSYRFKTADQRRGSQGVYLVFYKKGESFEEIYNDISDLESSESESEKSKGKVDSDKNKILVGYIVYAKQRDEFETVCIKEICIHKDYRQRGIGKNFIRRMCNNVFRTYGFTRVTFTASNYHTILTTILKKLTEDKLLKNVQTWTAWTILPGVSDERTIFSFKISDLNSKTE